MAKAQNLSVDLSRIVKEVGTRLDIFVEELSQDLMEETIKRTPVDTGNLRANWAAYKNNLPDGRQAVPIESASRGAGASKFPPPDPLLISRLNLVANSVKVGDTLFFANNAEYAAAVEFGRRDQPGRVPAAMVRSTVAMAPMIAQQTAQRIRRLREGRFT